MSSTRTGLSPLAAVGVGVLLVAGANFLGTLLFPVLSDGLGSLAATRSLTNMVLTIPHGLVSALITLGGIYAALTLDRFERPLLVVVPAVFVLSFLFVAGTGVLSSALSTPVQMSTGLSNGLSRAALVAAVTLLVRSLGVDSPDGSDSSGGTTSEQSLAD